LGCSTNKHTKPADKKKKKRKKQISITIGDFVQPNSQLKMDYLGKQWKYGRCCPPLTPVLIKQTLCLLFGIFVTSERKENLNILRA